MHMSRPFATPPYSVGPGAGIVGSVGPNLSVFKVNFFFKENSVKSGLRTQPTFTKPPPTHNGTLANGRDIYHAIPLYLSHSHSRSPQMPITQDRLLRLLDAAKDLQRCLERQQDLLLNESGLDQDILRSIIAICRPTFQTGKIIGEEDAFTKSRYAINNRRRMKLALGKEQKMFQPRQTKPSNSHEAQRLIANGKRIIRPGEGDTIVEGVPDPQAFDPDKDFGL